jgi:hypothetical protein
MNSCMTWTGRRCKGEVMGAAYIVLIAVVAILVSRIASEYQE